MFNLDDLVPMIAIMVYLAFGLFSAGSTEPAAKKILDKVYQNYERMGTLELQFSYEQKTADRPTVQNKGQLITKDKKFKLLLPEMEIYCDGKVQYTYLKKNNEVQITNPDEMENKYHPKNLASLYKSGTHSYGIAQRIKDPVKPLVVIEFKPKDALDPISKIRLYISEKTNTIEKVQWNERKGVQTTVQFTKSSSSKTHDDQSFILDTKSLYGVHVEDLREE